VTRVGARGAPVPILVVLSYGAALGVLVVVITVFARSSGSRRRPNVERADYEQLKVTADAASVTARYDGIGL